jgi:hypothetical protein
MIARVAAIVEFRSRSANTKRESVHGDLAGLVTVKPSPSAVAARCLAVLQATPPAARALFQTAWKTALAASADPSFSRLQANLADEIVKFELGLVQGSGDPAALAELQAFLAALARRVAEVAQAFLRFLVRFGGGAALLDPVGIRKLRRGDFAAEGSGELVGREEREGEGFGRGDGRLGASGEVEDGIGAGRHS